MKNPVAFHNEAFARNLIMMVDQKVAQNPHGNKVTITDLIKNFPSIAKHWFGSNWGTLS